MADECAIDNGNSEISDTIQGRRGTERSRFAGDNRGIPARNTTCKRIGIRLGHERWAKMGRRSAPYVPLYNLPSTIRIQLGMLTVTQIDLHLLFGSRIEGKIRLRNQHRFQPNGNMKNRKLSFID